MRTILALLIFLYSTTGIASGPKILKAKAELTPAQKYNFTVTIKHTDTGWDHYANAWRVYSKEGELIGERVLYHPHVKEQPFTRTLLGIHIPSDVSEVIIKANCSTTGENKKGYIVKLR